MCVNTMIITDGQTVLFLQRTINPSISLLFLHSFSYFHSMFALNGDLFSNSNTFSKAKSTKENRTTTHIHLHKIPARNGKHWEHKRYWPNQNRIRMRKYVMNVVSFTERSIDAWALTTPFLYFCLWRLFLLGCKWMNILEATKRLEMLLQVELGWKVRFCANNILWTFRKSVDLKQKYR